MVIHTVYSALGQKDRLVFAAAGIWALQLEGGTVLIVEHLQRGVHLAGVTICLD